LSLLKKRALYTSFELREHLFRLKRKRLIVPAWGFPLDLKNCGSGISGRRGRGAQIKKRIKA